MYKDPVVSLDLKSHPLVLQLRSQGLYCPAGDFYLDPHEPVPIAVVTHGHADHACEGSGQVYATPETVDIMTRRMPNPGQLNPLPYGQLQTIGAAQISLHPAGHVFGSSQVRVETEDGIWVLSGDYKRLGDPTCPAFEPVDCDVFITESTFGLPVYDFEPGEVIAKQIVRWWDTNIAAGRPSIIFAYSFGKAQRIMAELYRLVDRPIHIHGSAIACTEAYREAGINLPETVFVGDLPKGTNFSGELIIAPPNAHGTAWMKRFPKASSGFASGWMQVRGIRRRGDLTLAL